MKWVLENWVSVCCLVFSGRVQGHVLEIVSGYVNPPPPPSFGLERWNISEMFQGLGYQKKKGKLNAAFPNMRQRLYG